MLKLNFLKRLFPNKTFAIGFLSGAGAFSLLSLLVLLIGAGLMNKNILPANKLAKENDAQIEPEKQEPQVAGITDEEKAKLLQITDQDHIKGDKDAPVTIIEYSDIICPFCKKHHLETINKLMAEYQNKIKLVFRHFPLEGLHLEAPRVAEAVECAGFAGGEEAFWKYLDISFARSSELGSGTYEKIARELGIDKTKFENCLNSRKYKDYVSDSIITGSKLGIEGTPASFINGNMIIGAQPYEKIKEFVDSLIE